MNAADAGNYGATQQHMAMAMPAAKRHFESPARGVFVGAGIILLGSISILPIANAIWLFGEPSYAFFVGNSIPVLLLLGPLLTLIFYVYTVNTFFRHARPRMQTEQTVMMITTLFLCTLGVLLLLVSLPLWRKAQETYDNIIYRCEINEQTHMLFEYSQVLHDVRSRPECVGKFSVEECRGWLVSEPYTDILKRFESGFKCSGFCYRPPYRMPPNSLPNMTIPGNVPTVSPGATPNASSFIRQRGYKQIPHSEHAQTLALLAAKSTVHHNANMSRSSEKSFSVMKQVPEIIYPPTLFSDKNYQTSCDQQVARHMRNVAGDIGMQTYYQGVWLILIAIVANFLKLMGYCTYVSKGVPVDQTTPAATA